jgi:hypothetical protein
MHLAIVLEHVRMSPHQFVRDGLKRFSDPKCAHIAGDLRKKDPFEDVIANLFTKRIKVPAFHGIDDLVGFLENELTQRLERLVAIPWAPLRRSEHSHDVDETGKLTSGSFGRL